MLREKCLFHLAGEELFFKGKPCNLKKRIQQDHVIAEEVELVHHKELYQIGNFCRVDTTVGYHQNHQKKVKKLCVISYKGKHFQYILIENISSKMLISLPMCDKISSATNPSFPYSNFIEEDKFIQIRFTVKLLDRFGVDQTKRKVLLMYKCRSCFEVDVSIRMFWKTDFSAIRRRIENFYAGPGFILYKDKQISNDDGYSSMLWTTLELFNRICRDKAYKNSNFEIKLEMENFSKYLIKRTHPTPWSLQTYKNSTKQFNKRVLFLLWANNQNCDFSILSRDIILYMIVSFIDEREVFETMEKDFFVRENIEYLCKHPYVFFTSQVRKKVVYWEKKFLKLFELKSPHFNTNEFYEGLLVFNLMKKAKMFNRHGSEKERGYIKMIFVACFMSFSWMYDPKFHFRHETTEVSLKIIMDILVNNWNLIDELLYRLVEALRMLLEFLVDEDIKKLDFRIFQILIKLCSTQPFLIKKDLDSSHESKTNIYIHFFQNRLKYVTDDNLRDNSSSSIVANTNENVYTGKAILHTTIQFLSLCLKHGCFSKIQAKNLYDVIHEKESSIKSVFNAKILRCVSCRCCQLLLLIHQVYRYKPSNICYPCLSQCAHGNSVYSPNISLTVSNARNGKYFTKLNNYPITSYSVLWLKTVFKMLKMDGKKISSLELTKYGIRKYIMRLLQNTTSSLFDAEFLLLFLEVTEKSDISNNSSEYNNFLLLKLPLKKFKDLLEIDYNDGNLLSDYVEKKKQNKKPILRLDRLVLMKELKKLKKNHLKNCEASLEILKILLDRFSQQTLLHLKRGRPFEVVWKYVEYYLNTRMFLSPEMSTMNDHSVQILRRLSVLEGSTLELYRFQQLNKDGRISILEDFLVNITKFRKGERFPTEIIGQKFSMKKVIDCFCVFERLLEVEENENETNFQDILAPYLNSPTFVSNLMLFGETKERKPIERTVFHNTVLSVMLLLLPYENDTISLFNNTISLLIVMEYCDIKTLFETFSVRKLTSNLKEIPNIFDSLGENEEIEKKKSVLGIKLFKVLKMIVVSLRPIKLVTPMNSDLLEDLSICVRGLYFYFYKPSKNNSALMGVPQVVLEFILSEYDKTDVNVSSWRYVVDEEKIDISTSSSVLLDLSKNSTSLFKGKMKDVFTLSVSVDELLCTIQVLLACPEIMNKDLVKELMKLIHSNYIQIGSELKIRTIDRLMKMGEYFETNNLTFPFNLIEDEFFKEIFQLYPAEFFSPEYETDNERTKLRLLKEKNAQFCLFLVEKILSKSELCRLIDNNIIYDSLGGHEFETIDEAIVTICMKILEKVNLDEDKLSIRMKALKKVVENAKSSSLSSKMGDPFNKFEFKIGKSEKAQTNFPEIESLKVHDIFSNDDKIIHDIQKIEENETIPSVKEIFPQYLVDFVKGDKTGDQVDQEEVIHKEDGTKQDVDSENTDDTIEINKEAGIFYF